MVLPLATLASQPVRGWRVHDGQLLVRTPRGEEPCVCDCGRAHLLPTEGMPQHMLLLRCHGCGRHVEVRLA